MNLTEITEEIRERIGERTADFFDDDEVTRAVNEAIERFCAEEPWTWLLSEWSGSASEGENEIELPENISPNRVFVLSLAEGAGLARGYPLERLEPSAGFRYRYARVLTEGRPQAYYISRGSTAGGTTQYYARLIPTPDADYDLEALYHAKPDTLTGGTDVPDVPTEYQEAIIARAAGKLFLKEMDISQKASEQFGIYYEVLQQAREDQQNIAYDENIAWGREMPLSRIRSQHDYVTSRIPPVGLGQ
jgi:hypothetical protein